MEPIRQRSVLEAVLLETLADYPDGIKIDDAYDAIDRHYTLPEEWSRQIPESSGYDELKNLGYEDWRIVPQKLLVELVATEPQWQNEIRWARNQLRKLGYLDTTSPRGIWKLTVAGREAAGTVTTDALNEAERKIVQTRKSKTANADKKPGANLLGEGMRAKLLEKLEIVTRSMPLEDLKLVVEMGRVVRRRSISDVDA